MLLDFINEWTVKSVESWNIDWIKLKKGKFVSYRVSFINADWTKKEKEVSVIARFNKLVKSWLPESEAIIQAKIEAIKECFVFRTQNIVPFDDIKETDTTPERFWESLLLPDWTVSWLSLEMDYKYAWIPILFRIRKKFSWQNKSTSHKVINEALDANWLFNNLSFYDSFRIAILKFLWNYDLDENFKIETMNYLWQKTYVEYHNRFTNLFNKFKSREQLKNQAA